MIGFSESDIAVVGADLSGFAAVAGDKYTVVVKPTAAEVTLNISADVAVDASGNKNTAADEAASAFDDTKPTITISGVPEKSNAAFTAIITFSEDVTGFSESDITVVGATLSVFTKVADDKYTVVVTPTAAIVTLNIAAGVVVNVSNEGNMAADEATSTFDNAKPSVTINGVPAKSSAAFIVTIAFSENVIGFSESDITVARCGFKCFHEGC